MTTPEQQLGGSGTVTRIRSNSLTITPPSGRGDVQIESGGGGGVRPATVVIAAADTKHKDADILCTGVNDDVAINTAIAQLNALPHGGSILFLDGTYHLGHKIVGPTGGAIPGYTLRGAGTCRFIATDPGTFPDNCFLQLPGPDVSVNGSDSLSVVEGLCFDQTNAAGVQLQDTTAILIGTDSQGGAVRVQDCAFVNLQGHAIRTPVGATTVHVVRNWFGNCQRAGNFAPFDPASDGTVLDDGGTLVYFLQDNDFTGFGNNGNNGCDFACGNGTDFLMISGNTFGFSGGLVIDRAQNVTVVGNMNLAFRAQNGTTELVVTGNHGFRISLSGCNLFTIVGNYLTGRTFAADPDPLLKLVTIGLAQCGSGIVDGNYVHPGIVDSPGMLLSTCNDVTVTNNSLIPQTTLGTTHMFDGILIDTDSNRNNVQGNMVRPKGVSGTVEFNNGIHVANVNCDDNLVTNNDLKGPWNGAGVVNGGTGTVTAAGNRT